MLRFFLGLRNGKPDYCCPADERIRPEPIKVEHVMRASLLVQEAMFSLTHKL